MIYKLLSKIHDNYIAPLIIELIIAYLYVSNENDMELPTVDIPHWVLYTLAAVAFVWFLIALWNKRIEKLNKVQNPHFATPYRSLERAGEYESFDVKWDVNRTSGLSELQVPDQEKRYFIGLTPYCPKCGAQLEEEKSLLGYYVWSCPAEDFKKRTLYAFYKVAERTQNFLRRDIRNQILEDNHNR